MSQAELEKKYYRFVSLVHKMREKQWTAERYSIKSDRDAARALELKVDKVVKEERKRIVSGQIDLL